jgi:hypothetical protein
VHIDTFKLSASGVYVPFVRDEDGQLVQFAVAPMDGAQEAFICAPEREVGLAGNRGGGKTQIMLADYLSAVGRGWQANYKGILIRRSQREFTDLINLSESIIRPIWPKAAYNKLKNFWEFPDGEVLEFSYFDTPDRSRHLAAPRAPARARTVSKTSIRTFSPPACRRATFDFDRK